MPHLYDEDPRSTILIIPNLIVKPQRSTGVYLAGIFVSSKLLIVYLWKLIVAYSFL